MQQIALVGSNCKPKTIRKQAILCVHIQSRPNCRWCLAQCQHVKPWYNVHLMVLRLVERLVTSSIRHTTTHYYCVTNCQVLHNVYVVCKRFTCLYTRTNCALQRLSLSLEHFVCNAWAYHCNAWAYHWNTLSGLWRGNRGPHGHCQISCSVASTLSSSPWFGRAFHLRLLTSGLMCKASRMKNGAVHCFLEIDDWLCDYISLVLREIRSIKWAFLPPGRFWLVAKHGMERICNSMVLMSQANESFKRL